MGKDMNINHCFMGKGGCKNGSTIYLGVFIKVYIVIQEQIEKQLQHF